MTQTRRLIAAACAATVIATALALSRSPNESTATAAAGDKAVAWRDFGGIHPRVARDGSMIALSWQGAICRVPRDGGRLVRLTHGGGFDVEPAWSRDARRIAFIESTAMGGGPLRLIDAADGSDIPLRKPVVAEGTLDFHPDGTRILGVFRAEGQDYGLAWYDLESGEVTVLAKVGRRARFALSIDGRRVMYTSTMDEVDQQGGNNGAQTDLYLIASDGGKATPVGRFGARIYELCWSDGDRALVVSTDLGSVHNDLWRLPVEETANRALSVAVDRGRKLTFGQADEDRPSVAADRWLVYTDNHRGSTALVVRDLRTHADQTLEVTLPEDDSAMVHVRTYDPAAGDVTARVSLRRLSGKFHAPAGALYRVLNNLGHFYCRSAAEVRVPPGRYELRAWRGPEYRAAVRTFEVGPRESIDVPVELVRWRHAADEGWYSGENHIHANYGYGEWYNSPETMFDQCDGEDLNVCNFMVANSDGDAVFDREFFRGQLDPISSQRTLLYWNQEFRSTIWGHMTLVNLRQVVEPVFTGFKGTTNPWDVPTNSDIADRAHWQDGLVNYTHVAQNPDDPYLNPYTGKGIPVDVALGNVDTLDLNASYAGTVPLWYRLLNCGFHLPASAGTDCFLNRIRSQLPGGHRAYVQIDGQLTYEAWIDGLRAGRSFVTNSPMLALTVDGRSLGDTLHFGRPSEVHVRATASSQFPLSAIELVYNGRVIASRRTSGDELSATIDEWVQLERSGWLAARARGAVHPDIPVGITEAHTSPIYVDIAGRAAGSREDALYFLQWIDRLELAVRLRNRMPTDALQSRVRSQFEAARRVYAEIAARDE